MTYFQFTKISVDGSLKNSCFDNHRNGIILQSKSKSIIFSQNLYKTNEQSDREIGNKQIMITQ